MPSKLLPEMGWDPCELFPLHYSGVADAEAFPIPLGLLLQDVVPPSRNEGKEKKLPLPRSKQVSWEHRYCLCPASLCAALLAPSFLRWPRLALPARRVTPRNLGAIGFLLAMVQACSCDLLLSPSSAESR